MANSWLLQRIVELLATYLVQSTLFLAGTGFVLIPLLGRSMRRRIANPASVDRRFSPVLEERLWKLAAVLPLVTGPLCVCASWSRPVVEWSVNVRSAMRPTDVSIDHRSQAMASRAAGSSIQEVSDPQISSVPALPIQPITDVGQPAVLSDHVDPYASAGRGLAEFGGSTAEPVFVELPVEIEHTGVAGSSVLEVPSSTMFAEPGPPGSIDQVAAIRSVPDTAAEFDRFPGRMDWLGMVCLGWFGLSALRIAVKSYRVSQYLSHCRPVEGELCHLLAELAPRGSSIRLLRTAPGSTIEPFACGMWRWTIVVPEGIEDQLDSAERRALLAHELAHLVRRDPWWLFFGELLCTCLAIQPLNFVARRRWLQMAELSCDDWVVQQKISATSLALCLTRIVEARLDGRGNVLGLAAVGQAGSLTQRIEWLLRERPDAEFKGSGGPIFMTGFAVAAGLAAGSFGPRFLVMTSVVSAQDLESPAVLADLNDELSSALDEVEQLESMLESDPDPRIATATARIRGRMKSVREQLEK